jgi:hypothetical protein
MLIDVLKDATIGILKQDGFINPVFFLVHNEKLVADPEQTSIFDKIYGDTPNLEESKTRAVYCMGALAKQAGASRLIMVWDGAMRCVDAKSMEKYDETEAPLSYPKSMRTECVIINDINLLTGQDSTIIIPYKGGEGEPVELLEESIVPDGAKVDSRFTEIALKGYNTKLKGV